MIILWTGVCFTYEISKVIKLGNFKVFNPLLAFNNTPYSSEITKFLDIITLSYREICFSAISALTNSAQNVSTSPQVWFLRYYKVGIFS